MYKHKQTLFIGARGNYNKIPFEVVGSGQVDYSIKQVGNPDNFDDIGSTFPAVEYYCIANNKESWYFAVSDDQVYYCKPLDQENIKYLKNIITDNNEFSLDYFTSSNKLNLVEYGTGKLNKSEGRANNDFRQFANFEYYDFTINGVSYSVDIFPDGTEEWFETVWIPGGKLVDIFKESLRLNNPKVKEYLDLVKTWRNIAILSFVGAFLVFIAPFILESRKTEIYSKTQTFTASIDQEILFSDINIENPKNLHSINSNISILSGNGVSLEFTVLNQNNNQLSTNIQEYTASSDSGEKLFFPDKKDKLSILVRINDYGKLGMIQNTANTEQIQTENNLLQECLVLNEKYPEKCSELGKTLESQKASNDTITLAIKIYKNAVPWVYFNTSVFICILIGIFCLVMAVETERKIWFLGK